MNLARHYRTLGLHRGASSREVKLAYRKLVRQYHPDINPDKAAIEQFILINDAYTALSEALPAAIAQSHHQTHHSADSRLNSLKLALERLGLGNFNGDPKAQSPQSPERSPEQATAQSPEQVPEQTPSEIETPLSGTPLSAIATSRPPAQLSAQEESLKQEAYQQLKDLLRVQKFPRAIALVEGLAHRMPNDIEIIQWQAIVYQRWGRQLIDEGQVQKARIYLKKALRTDPNNPSLWREINHDFWQLANLGAHPSAAR
jgi:curved DNA-binding protein CbpA